MVSKLVVFLFFFFFTPKKDWQAAGLLTSPSQYRAETQMWFLNLSFFFFTIRVPVLAIIVVVVAFPLSTRSRRVS